MMNNVMVDNWFMENVVRSIFNNDTRHSRSYADLLMAIILWEDVYYPNNSKSIWNVFPSQVQDKLHPIYDYENEDSKEPYKQEIGDEVGCWLEWKEGPQKEPEIVSRNALRYMMLSSKNGCDYLPCEKRKSFLLKYFSPQRIQKALYRMKMQGSLDKTIEEYYSDTYKALLDFSDLNFEMPVLANFIFDNTPKGMTSVDYAFHLKNEGPVINYRKYLSHVEDALETQNWSELRYLLGCSTDVISDITSLDKKQIFSIGASIIPIPSLLLQIGGFNITASPSTISIAVEKCGSFKKMHLTFLRDLTKYAINDMHL